MPKRNLAWIVVIVLMALMMWQVPQIIAGRDSVYRAFGPLVDARAEIHKRFVDEVDDERIVTAAVDAGIGAMMTALHDPYASYLNDAEYDRFCKRTEGVVGGIGVDVWATDDGLEVLGREPNSPAAEAGINPGDVITHIEGQATKGVPLVELVGNLLNGTPGTELKLTIVTPAAPGGPPARPRDVRVMRTVIQLDPVRGWRRAGARGWRYMIDDENRIAYLRLTKFTQNVVDSLDAQVTRLLAENMRGLILDLRENTGGLLDGARDVADRFLEDGLIVSTRGRRSTEDKQWFAVRNGTYPPFKLAILVNGMTASAAEIVAGSLRDHGRAVVVGEQTHGKGCVQEVVRLDRSKGAIKLTTAYYYLPNGECIHRTPQAVLKGTWGVWPNIPVSMTSRQRQACLVVWRELSREPAEVESRPAEHVAGEPDEDAGLRARLLDADVQLRKALEELQRHLAPKGHPTSRPAEPIVQ